MQHFVGVLHVFADDFQLVNFEIEHDFSASGLQLPFICVVENLIDLIQKILLFFAFRILDVVKCAGICLWFLGLRTNLDRILGLEFRSLFRVAIEEIRELILQVFYFLFLHIIKTSPKISI